MQSAPLCTSTTKASCSGLPQSCTSKAASSALRLRSKSAARRKMRPRSVPVMADQTSNPRCAAATAASTSAASASRSWAKTKPVAGFTEVNAAPCPCKGLPSTKLWMLVSLISARHFHYRCTKKTTPTHNMLSRSCCGGQNCFWPRHRVASVALAGQNWQSEWLRSSRPP